MLKAEKDKIIKRLNVISGQMNGIKRMIETDRDCEDILIQVSSVLNSTKSFENEILKICIKDKVKNNDKVNDEDLLDRLLKIIDRYN